MRNERIFISLLYNTRTSLLIRGFLSVALLTFVIYGFFWGNFPRFSLFFLSLLTIIEIFIKFKIEVVKPSITVLKNDKDIFDSFTKEALEACHFPNSRTALNFLCRIPSVKFFLKKSAIESKELVPGNISIEDLAKNAFAIAKILNKKYVTGLDLITSYLLLSESSTKLLFNKKLKQDDILKINRWSSIVFNENNPKEIKIRFSGIGIGEALVWGWTPETRKYTNNLTFSHIKSRSITVGRQKEFENIVAVLQKESSNNILLVGDMGVGKENLVESLIYESYENLLPKKLNHRRFLEIMVGPFIAGTTNRADLETRLQSIIEEVKHSGDVILYIPEFQNLLGSSSYGIDLSGAILPYLKDGKMPMVATMTKGEYKKYFEGNSLSQEFQTITIEEPDANVALEMLFQKTSDIEKENKIAISYKAVLEAIKLADKYSDESLPGSAVSLLNDVANVVRLRKENGLIVTEEDVDLKVEEKSHIPLGSPTGDESKLLLNLEGEMHKSVIGQNEAIHAVSEAIRRIRAGLGREKPISFLFLGPTGVGKTQTAKTLANLYFKGEVHIVRLDMSEYGTEETLSRLIDNTSQSFLDQILQNPFSLVLLDEFEKANPKILNLFLQVLDDGRMTDNSGKTISFNNTIIIATSNAGSEFIRESVEKGLSLGSKNLLEFLQTKGLFTPELLNRFDEIVMFKPLSKDEIAKITELILTELTSKLAQEDFILSFDVDAIKKIAKSGFDPEFGARPLRRFIQDNIEDGIAQKIISREFVRGDKIKVSLSPDSRITITKI